MACFYCGLEKVVNDDVGACVECMHLVCIAGSRPPNRHHATQCSCGCGKLVCRLDYVSHSANHGSTPSNCFGSEAVMHGTAALGAIERMPSTDQGGPERQLCVDTVSRFLSFIWPGHVELRQVFRFDEDQDLAIPSHPRPVMFPQSALPPAAVTYILPMIAREVTLAWTRIATISADDPSFAPIRPLLDSLVEETRPRYPNIVSTSPFQSTSPRLTLIADYLSARDWTRPFTIDEFARRVSTAVPDAPWPERLVFASNQLPVSFPLPEHEDLYAVHAASMPRYQ